LIDSQIIKKNLKNIGYDVSRETLRELDMFRTSILLKNSEINLISKNSEKDIINRHILDSAQIIDYVDKNDILSCTDLGSGAGLPGIVIGILMKSKKPIFKLIFYEKSFHKSNFLKQMNEKFKLNAQVYQKNIFNEKNIQTDIIISRAFKPLPVVFELATKNFKKFKYIILFLGKSGNKILAVGGRVINFVNISNNFSSSREEIIRRIEKLNWKDGFYRSDIGYKVINE